jgi:ABC-type nitrate/sulfonate/bicarbonate transport system permease component
MAYVLDAMFKISLSHVDYTDTCGCVTRIRQLAALRGLPGYVLGPLEILKHFAKAFGSAELYEHIWASLARSLAGFALGSFLARSIPML